MFIYYFSFLCIFVRFVLKKKIPICFIPAFYFLNSLCVKSIEIELIHRNVLFYNICIIIPLVLLNNSK